MLDLVTRSPEMFLDRMAESLASMNKDRWPAVLKGQVEKLHSEILRVLTQATNEHRSVSSQEMMEQVRAWRKIVEQLPPVVVKEKTKS